MSMTVKGVTILDDANLFDSGPILMSSHDLRSCSSENVALIQAPLFNEMLLDSLYTFSKDLLSP